MKKVTLQDIAKATNVSVATVSRVIHNNGYVSGDARERITRVLEELGYFDQPAKVNTGTPTTVLFFVSPFSGNDLFAQILEELSIRLQQKGWLLQPYFLLEHSLADLPGIIDSYANRLKAIVFCCTPESFDFMPLRKPLLNSSVPVIMIERAPNIYGLNKVMVNSREMVFQAVRYLYQHGHRNIVFFAVDHHNNYDVEYERLLGFHEATDILGIARTCEICYMDDWRTQNGVDAMKTYAATHPTLPSAIFTADITLVGVMQQLHRMGVRVPEDISLLGMDNTYSRYISPPVSTVAFPVREICENAVRIIESHQGVASVPQSVLLSGKVIERQSVSAPAAAGKAEK